jgi:hypothetical protein
MATEIMCKRCHTDCRVTKSRRRVGDILELAEIIHHADGTRERVVYGRVNERTNRIVSAALIVED